MSKILIGSDHGGFKLKGIIINHLKEEGYDIQDFGCYSEESCDYPVIAKEVAKAVLETSGRAILVCGTGIGMSIAANRHKGIRAGLCHNSLEARLTREHNDANILCLGGRMIGKECALENVKVFLTTNFAGGRHTNRIKKLDN